MWGSSNCIDCVQVDVALQERLKRVMGEPSGSTERRIFVGGMPFGYEASFKSSLMSFLGPALCLMLLHRHWEQYWQYDAFWCLMRLFGPRNQTCWTTGATAAK